MNQRRKGHLGSDDENPGGQGMPRPNEQQEQEQLATPSLHCVKRSVNSPVLRLSNHALDVLLLLVEELGDMPRELYSARLASITARTSDIVFEVYQLAEDIAALTESEVAA